MTLTFPYPENESDFEELCLAILAKLWNCPEVERYARRGQKQDGIDVLDLSGKAPVNGAQCKRRNPLVGLNVSEIRHEVERARKFDPPVGRYLLMATAKDSAESQKEVLKNQFRVACAEESDEGSADVVACD